jgi:TetR/AcrR family transcriptional repressor of nem operon
MPRTREYNEDVVVHRAMGLFWRKGYDRATLPELLKTMRLSRGSFYHAFGTKREILVRAVRRYVETGMDGIMVPLGNENAGRQEIEQSFANLVNRISGRNGRYGCLVGNSMTEISMKDPETRDAFLRARRATEDALTRAVERGQAAGTVKNKASARAIGRFLLNTISGLLVSCKTEPGRDVLEDISRIALHILD